MAVTSTRSVTVGYSGDYAGDKTAAAAVNAASPGTIEAKALAAGANTINYPSTSITGLTILNSTGNTVQLTIKGVSGDTGIPLHKTDPTSIGVINSTGSLVLNAASTMEVRLFWT